LNSSRTSSSSEGWRPARSASSPISRSSSSVHSPSSLPPPSPTLSSCSSPDLFVPFSFPFLFFLLVLLLLLYPYKPMSTVLLSLDPPPPSYLCLTLLYLPSVLPFPFSLPSFTSSLPISTSAIKHPRLSLYLRRPPLHPQEGRPLGSLPGRPGQAPPVRPHRELSLLGPEEGLGDGQEGSSSEFLRPLLSYRSFCFSASGSANMLTRSFCLPCRSSFRALSPRPSRPPFLIVSRCKSFPLPLFGTDDISSRLLAFRTRLYQRNASIQKNRWKFKQNRKYNIEASPSSCSSSFLPSFSSHLLLAETPTPLR
jgi:hypothetical protein